MKRLIAITSLIVILAGCGGGGGGGSTPPPPDRLDPGHFSITNNPSTVDLVNRTYDGNMLIANHARTSKNFWCQTVAVQPNSTYDFRAEGRSFKSNQAVVQWTFNGQVRLEVTLKNQSEFHAMETDWDSGSSSSVEICGRNASIAGAEAPFAIDNISFKGPRSQCLVSDTPYDPPTNDGGGGVACDAIEAQCSTWTGSGHRPMPNNALPLLGSGRSQAQCEALCEDWVRENGEAGQDYTCTRHTNGNCHQPVVGRNSVPKNTGSPSHDCDGCQTNFCSATQGSGTGAGCNTGDASWHIGSWGVCNASSSTRTRSVTCILDGRQEVADYYCTNAGLQKPATSESCTPVSCNEDYTLSGLMAATMNYGNAADGNPTRRVTEIDVSGGDTWKLKTATGRSIYRYHNGNPEGSFSCPQGWKLDFTDSNGASIGQHSLTSGGEYTVPEGAVNAYLGFADSDYFDNEPLRTGSGSTGGCTFVFEVDGDCQ